jgi:hypothetical protein
VLLAIRHFLVPPRSLPAEPASVMTVRLRPIAAEIGERVAPAGR